VGLCHKEMKGMGAILIWNELWLEGERRDMKGENS